MNPRKMKLTQDDSFNAKTRNKTHIEEITRSLLFYYSDSEKKRRKNKHLCKYCYYINTRTGGSAITTVICAKCDKEMTFSTTCVDILCDKCAEELNLCKHCGQKMD